MPFRKNRTAGKTGGNPGFTPVDDVTGEDAVLDQDPDSTTGTLPSKETGEPVTKRRRASKRRGTRRTS